MPKPASLAGLLLAACLLVTSGCPGSVEEVTLYPVSGQVLFGDEPVPEGKVQFENSETEISGSSDIAEDGSYELSLASGTYTVTVTPPMVEVDQGPDSPPSEEYKEMQNIPQKYRASRTTDIKATVGEEALTFDVKMQP